MSLEYEPSPGPQGADGFKQQAHDGAEFLGEQFNHPSPGSTPPRLVLLKVSKMSLENEPASEPLHIYVKELCTLGGRVCTKSRLSRMAALSVVAGLSQI